MNIEISDNVLHSMIQRELTKVGTSSYAESSHLEKVVKVAVQEIAKIKVMELLKSDLKYVDLLNKLIEVNIVAAFELVAKRIAKDLGGSIVNAIESEFRTYSD